MSGQMMGVVLVDAQDEALRPGRHLGRHARPAGSRSARRRVGFERAYELLGHRLDPSYCLPKWMWLREHVPQAWSRATGVLVAKDSLTLRLTGRRCTDPSDASGTNAWDQVAGAWSDEMLAAGDIDAGLLPEVRALGHGGRWHPDGGRTCLRAAGGHAGRGRGRGWLLRRAGCRPAR